jgi:hypothetical protein
VLGLRRDDRVVVLDAGVVDDAAKRKLVEPGDVLGGLLILGVGWISVIISLVRKRELVRG